MARCKDCIHFGICEKGYPWADGQGGGWCEDFLTADVVPKSEVERLQIEIEALKIANEKMYSANKAQEAEIERLRSDIDAIFAELDYLMLDGFLCKKYPTKVIDPNKYAELKKKYTEGKYDAC